MTTAAFLAALDDSGQHWRQKALCAQTDREAFFPQRSRNATHAARAVCGRCDVRIECLAFAIKNKDRFGIWGGLTERERRNVKLSDLELAA